jgi:hypothetical protein
MPKQIERRRNGLGSVLDVRTVLLRKVRLQSGGDLVSCPQRRLHRVETLSPAVGTSRFHLTVRLRVCSILVSPPCEPVKKHAPDRPQH